MVLSNLVLYIILSQACTKTCYQQQVINLCHCADSYVEKYGAAFNYQNVSSCDVQNTTQGIINIFYILLPLSIEHLDYGRNGSILAMGCASE